MKNQWVYFIPSKRSAKVLEEYHNKPKFIKEICSIMVKKET